MGEHTAIGSERQIQRTRRDALRAPPGQAAPDLVGQLRDVKSEVAGARLDCEAARYAAGDVLLLAGAKAQYRGAIQADLVPEAGQLLVQQAYGGGGGCIVVIHHPDVMRALGERRLQPDRVTVGRAGVVFQRNDAYLAGPAAAELLQRRA